MTGKRKHVNDIEEDDLLNAAQLKVRFIMTRYIKIFYIFSIINDSYYIFIFQKKRRNVVGSEAHGDTDEGPDVELEKKLEFQCKRGDLVAIYARKDVKERFWVAEAVGPIKKGERPEQEFRIFYYEHTVDDYTEFTWENGEKKIDKVLYRHCLCPITPLTRTEDYVTITPLLRDKITKIGLELDLEGDSDGGE